MVTGSLSRGKEAGAWRWPSTPSSTEIKERVELYLSSPSGPSWPVLGWTSPLPLHAWVRVQVRFFSFPNQTSLVNTIIINKQLIYLCFNLI